MSAKKNASAGTKHSHTCTMAFGRYSAAGTCPRCDKLRNALSSFAMSLAKYIAQLKAEQKAERKRKASKSK